MNRARTSPWRGSVGVTMIIVLIIVELTIVAVVLAGGRDQDTTMRRLDSIRAFYAAEGGMNMAIREMLNSADEDGDGTVGSISNDGNAANDPAIGAGRVYVTASLTSGTTTLVSYGSSSSATRKISTSMGSPSARDAEAQQLASQATLSAPGTLTSITAYVKGPPPKLMRFAMYGDSAGEPDALLAQSANAEVGNNSALYWHTLTLPSTSLAAATYWLAMGFEHSNMYYSYQSDSGATRINANDPVANGFVDPWGSSTQSLTRTINIFATVMQDTTGPVTFPDDTVYENSNPHLMGLFRDVSAATYIQRGNDLGTGANTALNFTAGGGITVANAYTAFDTTPTDATQTDFTGSIRLTADMLFTGGGTKFIGLAALHNELAGQDGLAVVIKENGGNDRLEIHRMPQNGDISAASSLANSGNFNGISGGNWYRLITDVMLYNGTVEIVANIYTHTTPSDPNSSISASPLATSSYSAAVTSLTGLKTYGEVVLLFDATTNAGRGSITNLVINSNPLTFPTPTTSTSVMGWAEVP